MNVREFNNILPYLFGNEIDYLEDLAKNYTKYSNVVMLGVGPAMMALALLSGNRNLVIYGYDTQNFTGIEHVKRMGYDSQLIVDQGLSWNFAANWQDDSIDLLLVDACHDYDCVNQDIEAWYPKVKQDGVFYFHDFREPDTKDITGVARAISQHRNKFDMVSADYPGISIVLRKNNE